MRPKQKNFFTYAIPRKSSGGFALVGTLALAPLLIALMFGIAAFVWNLREATRLETLCDSHLFYLNNNYAKWLNELERLNVQVKKLRREEKKARQRLYAAIASGNAARIAAAELRLAQIFAAQLAVAGEQKKILLAAEALRREKKYKLRQAFGGNLKNQSIKGLAVRPDLPSAIAPVYELESPFFEKQKSQLQYQLPLLSFLPTAGFLPGFAAPISANKTCSVSIEKRQSVFRAQLANSHGQVIVEMLLMTALVLATAFGMWQMARTSFVQMNKVRLSQPATTVNYKFYYNNEQVK